MEIIGGIAGWLAPLVIIAGIVAAISAWRRREGLEGEREEDRGIGTVKRLYFYAGTFVYMMVAGSGVALIADYVLDELFGPEVLTRGRDQLALGVVLAAVWTPVWAWHRLRVLRFAEEEPAERRSVLRKLYVYLTLGVTMALLAYGAVEVLRWIVGTKGFDGYPVAALAVWGGLWALHWTAESAEGQPTDETKTVRRLYLYATAAYSLAMVAVGLGYAAHLVLRDAYEGLVDLPVLLQGEETISGEMMRGFLSAAAVGAVLWAFHWLYAARDDAGSDVRQFYSYVVAILGGVITVLSASGVIVFYVLQWLIGTPEDAAADAHFRILPGAVAALLVGLILWLYHWTVVREERAALGELPLARRTYGYIMAAIGIGTLASCIIVLVPTVVAIVATSARELHAGSDWWRDRMSVAFTLGLVGSPVWGYYWFSMQRRAVREGTEERTSLQRRVLIWGVLVAGSLAVLGSASHILYLVLDAILENELSLTLLRDGKWSMGVLVAGLLFVPYYWLILQEDRQATGEVAEEATAPRKSVTVLAGAGSGAFIGQLEAALGAKVRVLHRADPGAAAPELSTEQIQALERRIAEAPGSNVLVIPDGTGVQVFSYR